MLRDAVGMSQADLADALSDEGLDGFYPQTIVKLEKGRRGLKFAEGVTLARVLGVLPEDLLAPDDIHTGDVGVNRMVRAVGVKRAEVDMAFRELIGRYEHLVEYVAGLEEDDLSEGVRLKLGPVLHWGNPAVLAADMRGMVDSSVEELVAVAEGRGMTIDSDDD